MSKNWSTQNITILEPPATKDKAVDCLVFVLPLEDLLVIAALQQGNLIDSHFTLGKLIKYAFDLHKPSSVLLAACGLSADPDDASHMIICTLLERLKLAVTQASTS